MVLTVGALRICIEWHHEPLTGRRAEQVWKHQQVMREIEAQRLRLALRSNTLHVR